MYMPKEPYQYGQPQTHTIEVSRYPVTTGDTGRVRYELVATFGCEGTVGSVAVGNVDTVQSFDDGCVVNCYPLLPHPSAQTIFFDIVPLGWGNVRGGGERIGWCRGR